MNSTHHDLARELQRSADMGLSLAQVNAAVGGHLSTDDLVLCAWTFRSPHNRVRFANWAGLTATDLVRSVR